MHCCFIHLLLTKQKYLLYTQKFKITLLYSVKNVPRNIRNSKDYFY